MSQLCIDTNVYSKYTRNPGDLEQLLSQAENLIVSPIVIGELFAGFELGTRYDFNVLLLNQFLASPGVSLAKITIETAQRYGNILKKLKQQGTPIPTNDIWIAATAMETGARLVTYDLHFNNVPGLIVLSP
jgi:tRNA(fMet)-specific endonuclease VapC